MEVDPISNHPPDKNPPENRDKNETNLPEDHDKKETNPSENSANFLMDILPDELLENIFSHLPLPLLSSLNSVSTRWQAIIIRRFFHPHLATKEFSVRKQLLRSGWSPDWDPDNPFIYQLNKKLYEKITRELPISWTASMPTSIENVLWNYEPEVADSRPTAMAVYKDKLYVGKAGCVVEVWCLNSFSLTAVLNDDNEPGPAHISKSCDLALHGETLAVSCPARTKVRLFNVETDQMVGEIETQLGPIYKIVITDRLLICLSGWSLLVWKIDSSRPSTVRGKFLGVFPDYQSSLEFSNWLEVHSAVINSRWLVTHATRLRSSPPDNPRQRSVSFIQIRRLGPDGHLGPILRPEQSSLSLDVKELSCLSLSEGDLLAYLVMLQDGHSLRYVVKITNIENGEEVASIPSPGSSILGSVQMPFCWRGDYLYMKLVPAMFKPTQYQASIANIDDRDGDISVTRWSSRDGGLSSVPGVRIKSNNDMLAVEEARVVQVSTRLIKKEVQEDSDESDDDMEENGEDESSLYLVSAALYDYWNVMEE